MLQLKKGSPTSSVKQPTSVLFFDVLENREAQVEHATTPRAHEAASMLTQSESEEPMQDYTLGKTAAVKSKDTSKSYSTPDKGATEASDSQSTEAKDSASSGGSHSCYCSDGSNKQKSHCEEHTSTSVTAESLRIACRKLNLKKELEAQR